MNAVGKVPSRQGHRSISQQQVQWIAQAVAVAKFEAAARALHEATKVQAEGGDDRGGQRRR